MGYSITFDQEGYHWSVFQSAYGAACGCEPTLDEALVELSIAEAAITEDPYAVSARAKMRANPKEFAAPMNRPGSPRWKPMTPYNGPVEVRISDE